MYIELHVLIGRGVFTSQPIKQGAFVLEYRGELISLDKCQSRHYSKTQSTFLYEFEWKKQKWCIDASKEDGSLGRLVNVNHKFPNCVMKKVIVNDRPHLCLFAVRHIEAGTELDYNYGDSKWPWRIKVTNKQPSPVAADSEMVSDLSTLQKSQGDDANTQVTNKQPSPVAADSEMVSDLSTLQKSQGDDANTQMVGVWSISDPFYDSNESIVDETDDLDSVKDHSSVQTDDTVPKLRRTKSFLKPVLDFSDALYDSTDSDDTENPSTFSSKMTLQRPKRGCCHP
ncbi:histone-lysine N-methyltransferase EHMT1-like [Tachysurus vachellii]|uniref:histone-lysine N-methyltransferase EHMT1-like n=1 Tax=Tachysurus vachellii TaxID=175792 RepID=UPI00296AAA43|nr:histone-lysine N-methyltransferase EHMT1-like [Tachysurus vachellii]